MRTATAILPESFDPAHPQDVGPARSPGHSIRDRSSKQLTFGPAEAVKSKPTIARLRDAMDAFNIRGTCRLVAYELLTYWEPGGQVFPLVKTLAVGLGKSERVVQRQLDRLERVGLWVRIGPAPVGRPGRHPSLYELRLPKLSRSVTGDTSVTPRVTPTSPRSNQREVTSTNTAAAVVLPTVVSPFKDSQQQQQIKSEQRIDGQIASCEISARVLDVDFDAADHRERMQSGELSLEESQAFTDGLRLQRDDRTRRKGTAR